MKNFDEKRKKRVRTVLLGIILMALIGCGNNSSISKQNSSNEGTMLETTSVKIESTMTGKMIENNTNGVEGGKIKLIDTWHHYKETNEATLKKHEDAVNSFISDKIIIDIDYSKNYFIRNTDYKDADYFDEYWGYSTQIYYKDKE